MIRTVFHASTVGYYFFSLWYDQVYVKIPPRPGQVDMQFFNGRLKFLTIWNMLLQALFFTVCFLNDVIGTNETVPKKPPLIRKLKDVLLPSLAFPLSMFVGLTFWALYFVDRELVFPRALDPFFPAWLNHVMHTNIMIFILVEMFTTFRKYPKKSVGLSILGSVMVLYLVWIHIIHSYSGFWVYPVLDVLNMAMRWVFFAGLLGLSMGLYIVGEKLNNGYWKAQLDSMSDDKLN